ncbi:MAG TPA: 3-deoxy-manno-octulosonate cytidylyltransferase [Vicinamibacterales bacterium]|nr:3-deoxy-manno-octulosonate cytidylyltransferase [Vicinamibacterales bacterium]
MRPDGSLDGSPFSPACRVVVIPARYHSSRLPGKPLAEIGGRPMIQHVYERATRARLVDAVLVATDDERVREAVERFGGHVWLTRQDHRSGTDRVAEVAAGLACNVVVNVQGDEPLIEPDAIDEAIAPLLRDPDLLVATLCCRITEPSDLLNPNVVKVVRDLRGNALCFSRAPIPFARQPLAGAPLGWKHLGLYACRRDFLLRFARLPATPLEQMESLEQLRALEHGVSIRVVETTYDSVGVDTPADLERVRRLAGAGMRT